MFVAKGAQKVNIHPSISSYGYTEKGAAKYHCLNCGRYFNALTKTIFEHHKFPIEEMFYILEEMEKRRGRKESSRIDLKEEV